MVRFTCDTNQLSRWVAAVCLCAICFAPVAQSAASVDFRGTGGSINLIVADHIGVGVGISVHALFGVSLGNVGRLALNPNFGIWGGDDENSRYWHPDNYWYYSDLNVVEFSINFDARYYPPLKLNVPIEPYAGLGLAPLVTVRDWDPGETDTDAGVGANIFVGLDFPIAKSLTAFGELRGKAGSHYDVFKMMAGLTFQP